MFRLVRLSIAASLLAGAAPTLSDAHAQTKPADAFVSWQTPVGENCAQVQELAERLTRLTQRPIVFSLGDRRHELGIVIVAVRNAETWSADVRLVDADFHELGRREVSTRSPDCRALDVPVALITATLLDGLWTSTPPPQAATPHVSLGGYLTLGNSLGPDVSWSVGMQLAAATITSVEMDARFDLPVSSIDEQGRGARAIGGRIGLKGCPSLWASTIVALDVCLGAQLGAVFAHGVGLTTLRQRVLPIGLLGVEPRFQFALGMGLFIQLSLLAQWASIRSSFTWDVAGETRGLVVRPIVLGTQISLMSWLP